MYIYREKYREMTKKLKQTLVDWNYYKGNIVIQCNYNGKVFRYNAFKVPKEYFDKRTKQIKPCEGLFDYDFEVERMQKLHKNVNAAIVDLLKSKDTLVKKDIDEWIVNHPSEEEQAAAIQNKSLIVDFENWIKDFKIKKSKEDRLKGNDRKNHPTSKDYTSCLNLLKDYQHDLNVDENGVDNKKKKEVIIKVEDITDDFLLELMEYAYDSRPKKDGDYKYLTHGSLVNKTLQKRYDCMFTFMKNCYGKYPNDVKKPNLDVIISDVVRLETTEIKQLIDTKIKEPHYKKIRDYFIFLCHTGLRFSDFERIDRTFYDEKENELRLQARKTFGECSIILVDIAKQIGEKFNFTFKDYTNQAFNRELKEMLSKYNLFETKHTKVYYQDGRKTKTDLKRNFISSHTGRKTFISMLFENGFDAFKVMGMTGHKRIDTLRYYADKFGKNRLEQVNTMNELLNKEYGKKA